jgi:hypothetical protein
MLVKAMLVGAVVALGLVLAACSSKSGGGGGDTSNLKQIQQQKAGEYTVTVLNETGSLKMGKSNFFLEFRKADNQLADVGEVRLNSLMPMPGMAPMSGGASATPTGTPGRYAVEANFQMAGDWNFTVNFGTNQRVKFTLNAKS